MARNYVQGKDYRLAGSGVAATDTSIVLTSMQLPNSNANITMADFGAIGFATMEPETDREENISFTGITQNANGTATLTGVIRGLTFVSPSSTDINLRKSHSGGTLIRISNSVQFYENLANRYNTQSIFEVWSFTAGKNPKYLTQPASFGDLDLINKAFLSGGVYDYWVDSGSADTIVITPTTSIGAYTAGQHFFIKVAATNTGATTVNVNGLGAQSLKKSATVDLDGGDIVQDQIILVCHDGTNFQLVGGASNGAGGTANGLEQLQETFSYSDFADDGSGNGFAQFTGTLPADAVPVGVVYEFTIGFDAASTIRVVNSLVSPVIIGGTVVADAVATLTGETDGNDTSFDFASTPNPVVFMPGVIPSQGVVIITILYSTANAGGVITAGEDLTAGDTVGFASNIDDTVTKAVWAYRTGTYQPPLITDETQYSGISGICEIDTNKYVILVTNNASGIDTLTRALVVTFNPNTNTFSFGVPSSLDRIGTDGISICKVGTNKFAVAYFDANVNYVLRVQVGSVSGTTISFGTDDTYTSGNNGSTVDMVQLDTDRVALLVSNNSVSSVVDLFEVTFSGTVVTIGTPVSAVTPANNNIGLITKIATDKIAIIYNTTLKIATISAGVWTLGTGITLPSSIDTNLQYGKLGLLSIVSDTLWISSELSNSIYYLYYTVSGTVPTLVASGSYADASEELNTLLTDGTDVFLFAQSANQALSGVAKLSVNGASIDRSPFAVRFNMGGAYVPTVGMPLIKNNTIQGTNYYGIVNYLVTTGSRTITLNYHIKGMTEYFAGIVQSNVSKGSPVNVKTFGIDTHQSGLTPGALYEPYQGGITNTVTTGVFTMQALSATDIKIS